MTYFKIGGISQCMARKHEGNNAYFPYILLSFFMYFDAKHLYGHSMSQRYLEEYIVFYIRNAVVHITSTASYSFLVQSSFARCCLLLLDPQMQTAKFDLHHRS